ncbi:NAD(P)-dependent alcohol dehydrogenase [Mycolicibacterium wolinskyi]|uniref:Alcohol dehydrogenase n=1 Tax=Mycolicibacterium wolinskyi TaxID=59750 RepID=A0A1X2F2Y6_9MYCO|nr:MULTISPECIES: NAD(P)-dependent alcohol dehydrogenase [Mycolicibacterium]MCV7287859.1 NAD(P)-dependent alcohol dehydrogenase [Mycolicibacterium wolinskyi]MCV7294757.1 NAD(P)-dependent alcohol dehydrogenase [Mycolicibacterium goodii]ORX12389.1 alcohol dehydrogenase [Mycolicibacterium wolinskyi]
MIATTAAVSRAGASGFVVEELSVETPRADEVIVRFLAAGLCRTDLEVAAGRLPTPLPVVSGHEGAGVVEYVGSGVEGFAVGDRVIAGFNFCGCCANCRGGMPAYCPDHFALNFGAQRADGSVGLSDQNGRPVHDHFFGQSSFAGLSLCRPSGLVRVNEDIPASVLAPLGCGVSTGVGAVWNVLKAEPGVTLLVIGAGAVGLSAVMAAVASGAGRIIVADRHTARLDLAVQLGATDVVDVNTSPPVDAVMELTGGAGVGLALESTGSPESMTAAVGALAPLGRAAILGIAPPQAQFRTDAFELLLGRSVMGSVIGHQAPAVLIPRILRLYRQGRFPIERLTTLYPLESINDAVADVEAGVTVKAVLQHRHDQEQKEYPSGR